MGGGTATGFHPDEGKLGGSIESRASHTQTARIVEVVQNFIELEDLVEHEELFKKDVVDRFRLPYNLRGAKFDIRGIGTLQVYGERQELPDVTAQYTAKENEVWEIEVGDREEGEPGHVTVNIITTDKNRRKIITPLKGSREAISHIRIAFEDLLADHENPSGRENRGEVYLGGGD